MQSTKRILVSQRYITLISINFLIIISTISSIHTLRPHTPNQAPPDESEFEYGKDISQTRAPIATSIETNLSTSISSTSINSSLNNDYALYHHASRSMHNSLGHTQSARCVPLPKNFTQCGLTNFFRLPNLLQHNSMEEIAAYEPMMNSFSKFKCSRNFDLFMCSILNPVCLDVLVLPCKTLCQSVKRNCAAAMLRQGYSWPIDCSTLPTTSSNCISRKLPLRLESLPKFPSFSEIDIVTTTKRPKRRKVKKVSTIRQQETTSIPQNTIIEVSTTNSIPEYTTTSTTTIKPQTTKPVSEVTTASSSTTTTTEHVRNLTDIIQSINSNHIEIHSTMTNSTEKQSAITQNKEKETINYGTGSEETNLITNSTQDLAQIICSLRPDILIKTRFPDDMIISSVNKMKMRIRSYKKILRFPFHQSINNSLPSMQAITTNSSLNTTLTTKNPTLNLTLTNSTLFVSAAKDRLFVQSLNTSFLPNDTLKSTSIQNKTIRTYLVAVDDNSVRIIILWPDKYTESEPNAIGPQSIVKAYRQLKSKRGSKNLCAPKGEIPNWPIYNTVKKRRAFGNQTRMLHQGKKS